MVCSVVEKNTIIESQKSRIKSQKFVKVFFFCKVAGLLIGTLSILYFAKILTQFSQLLWSVKRSNVNSLYLLILHEIFPQPDIGFHFWK